MTTNILKPSNRWLIGLILTTTAITGATGFYVVSQSSQPSPPMATTPPVTKVTALGRLEPETETIKLFAPSALDGDRVDKLLVKQGDRVRAGQTIAILDSRDRLQDALEQAREQVRVAQAKLAQVRAGAKTGEIQAQQATIARYQAEIAGETATQNATIARYQAEVRNAQADYNRFEQLYHQGAISASNIDSRRLTLETAQAQLNEALSGKNRTVETLQAQLREAKATLNRIAEVRPVDVNAAQTEVDTAIAAVKTAETQLQQAYIRAPMSGQILKIRTREGEKIGDSGIVEMGQTAQMVAVAEVYQTDIGKVRLGQPATISSQVFSGQLRGTVSQIGLQVDRQNVFSNQPGENLDRRVVEVKIRLQPKDSQRVAGLTNLQVETAIQL
jgi:HlyD family secretion protein